MNAAAYSLDSQVGYLMRKANQRHLAIFSAYMPEMTPRHFAALARLNERGPLSQNDLGRQIAMDAATAKVMVDKLAENGLVKRSSDPADRRRRLIGLTPAGQARFAASVQAAHTITAETLSPLTADEAAHLTTLLAKLAGPETTA
jgi:DNA-binding MarR family transcriptional regulator